MIARIAIISRGLKKERATYRITTKIIYFHVSDQPPEALCNLALTQNRANASVKLAPYRAEPAAR